MSRIWHTLALSVSLAVVAADARAQQRGGQAVPRFHVKIALTDTLQMSAPELSPDGKWVVYGTYEVGRSNIWVLPAAGGAPHQLTTGDHVDADPRWFPRGDRIAFQSDRTKSLMILDFDKATGRAVGTPRRVTLEEVKTFAIAEDGSRIAYLADRAPEGTVLKQVPAAGGKATTIAELPPELAQPSNPRFSPDGAWIYFAVTDRPKRTSTLLRVAVTGGKPEPVNANLIFPSGAPNVIPIVGAQQVVVLQRAKKLGTVMTFGGDTVSTFNMMQTSGDFSRVALDNRNFLLVYSNIVTPTRLVGTDGRARTIGSSMGYEWPAGWSRDNKQLFVEVEPGVVATMNADGSGRIVERIAPKNLTGSGFRAGALSADWRHILIEPDSARRSVTRPLFIYDRETKTAREVTRRAEQVSFLTGLGDWYGTNHGEFLYTEGSPDRVEIHGVKPTGENRVIRSFPRDVASHAEFAVDGDKIAYQVVAGDSASLFAITEANGEPKRLMSIRGRFEELVWSPDTKTIAAYANVGRDGATKLAGEMIFVPVATPAQSRSIPLGEGGYETVWTPDGRAVYFLKADKGWSQMSVWRYPLNPNEPARNLTQNETGLFWGYQMSSDGSTIALPEEQSRGSSLWRVDLTQAAAAYRDAKAKAMQAGKP